MYLWVEAYLTNIAGDDRSLCLHYGWPKGVCHHSFLDRIHLQRQNPEVTSKIQKHRRISEQNVSLNCTAFKWELKVLVDDREMCQRKKCMWMTGEEKEKNGIEEWAVIDVDRRVCVFSAAAGAAVCAWILGCCSNVLIHAWVEILNYSFGITKNLSLWDTKYVTFSDLFIDLFWTSYQSVKWNQHSFLRCNLENDY